MTADPWALFDLWMRAARRHEPRVADAAQLATVASNGHPSQRTVLVKEWPNHTLQFFTDRSSRKAVDLDRQPNASLLFHWKSLERQVIFEGQVTALADDVNDRYFASRPRGSQIAAWTSHQSKPIPNSTSLEAEYEERLIEFRHQTAVARPARWGGYSLSPTRIEFWQGKPNRLHERQLYAFADNIWTAVQLYP